MKGNLIPAVIEETVTVTEITPAAVSLVLTTDEARTLRAFLAGTSIKTVQDIKRFAPAKEAAVNGVLYAAFIALGEALNRLPQ